MVLVQPSDPAMPTMLLTHNCYNVSVSDDAQEQDRMKTYTTRWQGREGLRGDCADEGCDSDEGPHFDGMVG